MMIQTLTWRDFKNDLKTQSFFEQINKNQSHRTAAVFQSFPKEKRHQHLSNFVLGRNWIYNSMCLMQIPFLFGKDIIYWSQVGVS